MPSPAPPTDRSAPGCCLSLATSSTAPSLTRVAFPSTASRVVEKTIFGWLCQMRANSSSTSGSDASRRRSPSTTSFRRACARAGAHRSRSVWSLWKRCSSSSGAPQSISPSGPGDVAVQRHSHRVDQLAHGEPPGPHPFWRYAPPRMPTCVVTGGAGFLGSHLCDHLLAQGHRVICIDNLDTGSLSNIEHIRDQNFLFVNHDLTEYVDDRRAGGPDLPHGLAGEPDRLRAAAASHAQGRLDGDPSHARRREGQARADPARLDLRGLRRSAGPSAARGLLGPRQPDRAARRLRRGEALRRGADDGLPPPAGRRHVHRADLQHDGPADAARTTGARSRPSCARRSRTSR